jgi:hypothetical protein
VRIWTLDVESLDQDDVAETLRFSNREYIGPGPVQYYPRIIQPGLFNVRAFGVLSESSRSGFGETTLANADGGLNYLDDYAVDGRAANLKLIEDGVVQTILAGTVQSLRFEDLRVVIKLRDPQESLALPHPQSVYAGNNSLPNGEEGVATDIKGQNKPRVYGKVRNASPKFVNTSRLIYQVSDQTAVTVTNVRDRGVELTNGGAYADLATLRSTAPAAGNFRAFQGYFRLGSTPTGDITCDADNSVDNLGSVFEEIASEAGATVNASDVTTLDALGEVGIYLTETRTTADMLDQLAQSAGGYWTYDSTGEIRVRELIAPASPSFTLEPYKIIKNSMTRIATGAAQNGLPYWRVVVKADPIETVQTDTAATAVNAARFANQYRDAIYESASTKTRHPLADELVITSCLRSLTDAQTLADRLGALLSVRRDRLEVTARLTDPIEIGSVCTLTTPRLGYENGRDLIVVGFTLDAAKNRATLSLWG